MNIENTNSLNEREKTVKMAGIRSTETNSDEEQIIETFSQGDLTIVVERVNQNGEFGIVAKLENGHHYNMKVSEAQLEKLKTGEYTVTLTPETREPMLMKIPK